MLGRVRASPSSLDCFDTPPSKIFKDDPLSIYEATLMKLKLGSQRDLTPSMESMEMESNCTSENETVEPTICSSINESDKFHNNVSSSEEENMVIDTDSTSSTSVISSASVCRSTCDSKQGRSKSISLLYMFSKYNNARSALNSSQGESVTDTSQGSVVTSPGSSGCLDASCTTAD